MTLRAVSVASENIEDARAAGVEVAEAALAQTSLAKRSVGILLASIEVDREKLLEGIRSKLDVPIIGCTTYSEATHAGYTEDSVTLFLLTSDTLEIGIGLGENLIYDIDGAVTKAWDDARRQLSSEPRLAFVFPDAALIAKGELIVDALVKKSAGKIPIMGGCPGDGGAFKKTFQFANGQVYSDAIPILLLGGADVEPVVITETGWEPMGVKGTATKVDGTRLLEVDGRPAIEYVGRYIANIDDPEVLGTFPIAVFDKDTAASSEPRYMLRSPFFYDKETGSVAYGGLIPEGCSLQMGRAYRDRVIASSKTAAEKVLEQKRNPTCVFFASCGARKLVLGGAIQEEVNTLKAAFSDGTPIAGFYSYGEIGPFDSRQELTTRAQYHNCTLVVCAL